ncbi:MAG: hypothetical protein VBE63_24275 [Lamprobacter sp.]|uniref:hypothetical protein n=1 Tax=Lamprobacter sp. TaxID=3100796 RepID=UPI002B25F528|nr:hypothetical protein [Lamprobacter sp.]MEA3643032.1 hypothetical protein [Lamprobacter sp.]
MNAQLRSFGALARARALASALGFVRVVLLLIALSGFLLHPAGLEARLALLALEPRDLIAQLLDGLGLLLGLLGQGLDQAHQLLDQRCALGLGNGREFDHGSSGREFTGQGGGCLVAMLTQQRLPVAMTY